MAISCFSACCRHSNISAPEQLAVVVLYRSSPTCNCSLTTRLMSTYKVQSQNIMLGTILYRLFKKIWKVLYLVIKVFSPTNAQFDSLKNNFKFALKLTLKSSYMFRCKIIREHTIWALLKLQLLKCVKIHWCGSFGGVVAYIIIWPLLVSVCVCVCVCGSGRNQTELSFRSRPAPHTHTHTHTQTRTRW
jgi:hypothetical protein